MRRPFRRAGWFAAPFLITAFLSACSELRFYGQAAVGQAGLLLARRPIAAVKDDPETPAAIRDRLAALETLRDFAQRELLLPVGSAYRDFVALDRPYVLWNVFAAPEFSLAPKTWCYPLIGCAAYRAYFSPGGAQAEAERLRRRGYDVLVAGVLAYSTLGWFDDPVLSTWASLDEERLAALLFHELAHRLLYVAGDTAFNEGFATAVEEEGLRRWAAAAGRPGALAAWEGRRAATDRLLGLVARRRAELERLYASELPPEEKRAAKAAVFALFLQDLKEEGRGDPVFAAHRAGLAAAGANNAALVPLAAYHDRVPAFRRLLAEAGFDLGRFYEACRRLAALSPEERREALERLAAQPRPNAGRPGGLGTPAAETVDPPS